jgi:hypothetical protein
VAVTATEKAAMAMHWKESLSTKDSLHRVVRPGSLRFCNSGRHV